MIGRYSRWRAIKALTLTVALLASSPIAVIYADNAGGQGNGNGNSGSKGSPSSGGQGNSNGGGQGSSNGGGQGNSNGGGQGNSNGGGQGNSNGRAQSNANGAKGSSGASGGNGDQGNSSSGANGQGSTTGAVSTVNATVSSASGGTVTAGSVTVSLPSSALAGVTDSATIAVKPVGNLPVPGGPVRFSPNGTLADISISDAHGMALTTFPAPITLSLRYNAADLAMAGGDPKQLGVAFVVDASTPTLENPMHFPVGTFVLASNVSSDVANGQVIVLTQALGSVVAVVANPLSYVETLQPGTAFYSSFDPTKAIVLGTTPQFKTLQLAEPQIGTRLLVFDPDTGNYAYVDAASVGPSGPPRNTAPAGVTRGLLQQVAADRT